MSAAGRIGLGFIKWLVVPLALGGLGYYIVGPQIGKQSAIQPPDLPGVLKRAPRTSLSGQPRTTDPEAGLDEPERKYGEPDVEVTVSESSSHRRRLRPDDTAPTTRRRNQPKRSQRKTPKPAETSPKTDSEPPADENADPAGAGGLSGDSENP